MMRLVLIVAIQYRNELANAIQDPTVNRFRLTSVAVTDVNDFVFVLLCVLQHLRTTVVRSAVVDND